MMELPIQTQNNGTSNVYQNGLYWAPLYDGYNKISAAVTLHLKLF